MQLIIQFSTARSPNRIKIFIALQTTSLHRLSRSHSLRPGIGKHPRSCHGRRRMARRDVRRSITRETTAGSIHVGHASHRAQTSTASVVPSTTSVIRSRSVVEPSSSAHRSRLVQSWVLTNHSVCSPRTLVHPHHRHPPRESLEPARNWSIAHERHVRQAKSPGSTRLILVRAEWKVSIAVRIRPRWRDPRGIKDVGIDHRKLFQLAWLLFPETAENLHRS